MIKLGDKPVDFRLGDAVVPKIYLGDEVVWSRTKIRATWNQVINYPYFNSTDPWSVEYSSSYTLSLSDNVMSVRINNFNTTQFCRIGNGTRITAVNGEKWYGSIYFNGIGKKIGIYLGYGYTIDIFFKPLSQSDFYTGWTRLSNVDDANATDYSSFQISPYNLELSGYQPGDILQFKSPIAVNLTQMFGAGNEPTLTEFERQCALNGIDLDQPQPYNTGTIIDWYI